MIRSMLNLKYGLLKKLAVSFCVRTAKEFCGKYVMKRNMVESIAHRITGGDPTFQNIRDVVFAPIARLLIYVGFKPNLISLLGLLFAIIAAFVVNDLLLFSIFIILNMLFDGVDGVVARRLNLSSDFGSIVDVTCDTLSLLFVSYGLYFYGALNAYVFIVYAVVNILYTFRSAIKSKVLENVFRSIGSRIFAFIGLVFVNAIIAVGGGHGVIYINVLFGFIAVLLMIAYCVDLIFTRQAGL